MTKNTLPVMLERAETRVAEVLPPGMDAGRVMRLARMAIHKNPYIAKCDPISVIEAILQASRLGLELDSPIGGAHLVPFKNKVQMIVDYRALVRLALQSGMVAKIAARPVYEGEMFRVVQGTNDAIIHEPRMTGVKDDEDIIGFYAVAKLTTGESVHEYASVEEVNKIRGRSKSGAKGPWATDYAMMGQKTMIKRLAKWLPMAGVFGEAVRVDTEGDLPDATPAAAMAQRALEAQEGLREALGEGEPPAEVEGAEA